MFVYAWPALKAFRSASSRPASKILAFLPRQINVSSSGSCWGFIWTPASMQPSNFAVGMFVSSRSFTGSVTKRWKAYLRETGPDEDDDGLQTQLRYTVLSPAYCSQSCVAELPACQLAIIHWIQPAHGKIQNGSAFASFFDSRYSNQLASVIVIESWKVLAQDWVAGRGLAVVAR